jgi:hypothetical protein
MKPLSGCILLNASSGVSCTSDFTVFSFLICQLEQRPLCAIRIS